MYGLVQHPGGRPHRPSLGTLDPDLADEDVVEEDDLLGARAARPQLAVSAGGAIGGALGTSASFKRNTAQTSILGGATSFKLAPSISAPQPAHAFQQGGYGSVIATSSSRPAAGARAPRVSAPSSSGGCIEYGGANGVDARLEGDILGDDTPQQPQPTPLPLRGATASNPGSSAASSSAAPSAASTALRPPGMGQSLSMRRGAGGAPLPCISSDAPSAAARPPLARNTSLNTYNDVYQLQPRAAQVAVQPKARGDEAHGSDRASSGKPIAESAASPVSGSRSLKALVRVASGGIVAPQLPSEPLPDVGASEEGKERKARSSSGGIRGLFSRDSSGRRASDVGGGNAVRPHEERIDEGEALDGPVGGGRPPSGLLKRTASALVAWAR